MHKKKTCSEEDSACEIQNQNMRVIPVNKRAAVILIQYVPLMPWFTRPIRVATFHQTSSNCKSGKPEEVPVFGSCDSVSSINLIWQGTSPKSLGSNSSEAEQVPICKL